MKTESNWQILRDRCETPCTPLGPSLIQSKSLKLPTYWRAEKEKLSIPGRGAPNLLELRRYTDNQAEVSACWGGARNLCPRLHRDYKAETGCHREGAGILSKSRHIGPPTNWSGTKTTEILPFPSTSLPHRNSCLHLGKGQETHLFPRGGGIAESWGRNINTWKGPPALQLPTSARGKSSPQIELKLLVHWR